MIPKDPVMLLSFMNMRLRDFGMDLDELCDDLDVERSEIEATLAKIDYHYDKEQNRFV
ncbi:MAG: DUF4250 domain-containing protein [Lachnospiraceae bacterium]|nr:DUF4250 domain-containing protein [Lachnospiraceae bacterium]MBR4059879.1 DUF4250 domain-containing protein [Lachnospiraceae bacterium]